MLGGMGQRDPAGRRVLARVGRHEILLTEVVVTAIQLAVLVPLLSVAYFTDWSVRSAALVAAVTVPYALGRLLRLRLGLVPPLDPPLAAWKRPLSGWKQWWAGPSAGPVEGGREP
jgi:hypothetical protein